MSQLVLIFFLLIFLVVTSDAARILAVYPLPSFSHQVVFRPLTLELVKRGHEVVVITTDPIFKKDEAPANLTEIDVHDISYTTWRKELLESKVTQGNKNNMISQIRAMGRSLHKLWVKQIHHEEFQSVLNNKKKFDLLIHEGSSYFYLALSHVLKVPVIQISSLGSILDILDTVGAPTHPIYPFSNQQKIYNLSVWEKLSELYNRLRLIILLYEFKPSLIALWKKEFGPNVPDIRDLRNNVELVFLNVYPFWELNRPAPPNLIYLGGLHQQPQKELPKDLKSYLDSSKNGVIYISFGTNIEPSLLPPQKIQTIINVLSKLPYDVLWKWNSDEMPGRSANIKISKWLPQADLLRHPKLKMFITQGGLQSTDEAITAGVPLIGIPMLGDQWYNVEHYVHHGIGVRVDMETIDEEKFGNSVNEILYNDSYRQNILRLRTLVHDQPQTSLERAVWWTEYVIRHRGAKLLRSPAANISWAEYLMVDVLLVVAAFMSSLLIAIVLLIKFVLRLFKSRRSVPKTKRS